MKYPLPANLDKSVRLLRNSDFDLNLYVAEVEHRQAELQSGK